MKLNESRNDLATTSAWRSLLDRETQEMDRAGVKAAVIVIGLREQIDLSDSASNTGHPIVERVLDKWLQPTDRASQTSSTEIAILLSPTADLAQTVARTSELGNALEAAGLQATCSFAQRRTGETLVSSWGRAQSELDRVMFRETLPDFLSV